MKNKAAVSLPEPLLEAADRMARDFRIPVDQLVCIAVEHSLQEHDPEGLKGTPERRYAAADSSVDPVTLLPEGDW